MRRVFDTITDIRGNLITAKARGSFLGELAEIERSDGHKVLASVLSFEDDKTVLQVFENPRGISTGDKIAFLAKPMRTLFSNRVLGRRFDGKGLAIDGGPPIAGEEIPIDTPSFNPVRRIVPKEQVRTNIPMIDVFNCLVKSQKIPIFSIPGEPYNQLLMRIANQTDADVVVIGGMGLRFDDYEAFIENSASHGSAEKTVMYIHQATDPAVECLLVPDMALATAEQFATQGKDVLVLLTDMSAYADAIKEIAITMDQVPSNRGYPGSLYSDLAKRYEKAVDIDGSGSITIIAVTTMPGGDVTHPIPDNTGYITEGQFYLHGGRIDPFGSLSRLKQQVIGEHTREDHGELANTMIRLYADSKKAREREAMGFKLSAWDRKLLHFSELFEEEMMDLNVDLKLEDALNLGWKILSESFSAQETGMKKELVEKYWPKK